MYSFSSGCSPNCMHITSCVILDNTECIDFGVSEMGRDGQRKYSYNLASKVVI